MLRSKLYPTDRLDVLSPVSGCGHTINEAEVLTSTRPSPPPFFPFFPSLKEVEEISHRRSRRFCSDPVPVYRDSDNLVGASALRSCHSWSCPAWLHRFPSISAAQVATFLMEHPTGASSRSGRTSYHRLPTADSLCVGETRAPRGLDVSIASQVRETTHETVVSALVPL